MLSELQIQGLRWAVLRTIMVGGHIGVTDVMVLDVARAEYLGATRDLIRNELGYLEDRKLVRIERSEIEPWRVLLTRHGRDVVDYTVDCEPGIRRPPRLGGEER